MDILSAAGIFVSLIIAIWQYWEASRAKKELAVVLSQLPETIVSHIVKTMRAEGDLTGIGVAGTDRVADSTHTTSARYIDLDNDGRDELVVEFPVGVHGSAVQIYKVDSDGAKLLDEWSTDVPYGFEIDTSDATHSPLMLTGSTNASSQLPYAMGLRDTIWLKLVNGKLVEHKRVEPSLEDIQDRMREIRTS